MLNLLRPKNSKHNKIRLGNTSDSGYIVPEIILEKCESMFSYGVGKNWTFENEFIEKYNKPVYMFDHTIGLSPFKNDKITFTPEGLGFVENCDDFINHYSKLKIKDNVFLKIDIEGNEWMYFMKTDISKISLVTTGLCLEIHGMADNHTRKIAENILTEIEKYFILSHIHGNNQSGLFTYEKYFIPDVMELTYINKNIENTEEYDTQTYPIKGLDYPNNPNKPDYKLKFINN